MRTRLYYIFFIRKKQAINDGFKKAAAIATAFPLPVFRKALPFPQMYEIVVDTATLSELFVRALFGDFPLGHDDNFIRRADGV